MPACLRWPAVSPEGLAALDVLQHLQLLVKDVLQVKVCCIQLVLRLYQPPMSAASIVKLTTPALPHLWPGQ